ncbi:hotdog domain-containing protein [Cytobacillus praedii]|uniref:hotdog domain-containing protein n=1 Tax=Cytobacillus praedii TaxID=1742358 RepID=UPI002E2412EE|nr:hotdog domain-containing protein [Cytobacillus praedii]
MLVYIAAIIVMKHSVNAAVKASMDTVSFLSPARVGVKLILDGVVISTGRTLMEVYVKVECQHLETVKRAITTTAILTMFAVYSLGIRTKVSGVGPRN